MPLDDFRDSEEKEPYQAHSLCTDGVSDLRSKWRKVKWTLCKRKDVVCFKANILAHTESIQLLLATIQLKNVNLGHRDQKDFHSSLIRAIENGFSKCIRSLTAISSAMINISDQIQDCLENTRRIISMNIRVFHVVLDIQNLLRSLPRQIERQQPVYLNDALGPYCPFHLEFICSSEALISVLSINFKWLDSASRKTQDGEFSIHDTGTKRDIDLSRPWEECLLPGQHVEMSMIFLRSEAPCACCPKCRYRYVDRVGEDVDW